MKRHISLAIIASICVLVCLLVLFPFPAQGPSPALGSSVPVSNLPTPTATAEQTPPPPTPPLPTPAPDAIRASHAFVYNVSDDAVYYTKGGTAERVAPASLTKLFTAFVVLELLDPAQVVTVGEEVTWVDPDSSLAYILPGHKLRVDMLVEGMLLNSGNDAAYTLAVAGGRKLANNQELSAKGAFRRFMEHMNLRAQGLDLTGTHFVNPDGIDEEDHYTCIQDLITIARISLANPTIAKYAGMKSDNVTFASGETIQWYNTNYLLHKSTDYYCAEAVGLKTGSTSGAGKCLISAFRNGPHSYLIVGVLGCQSDDVRYSDTLLLYNMYR